MFGLNWSKKISNGFYILSVIIFLPQLIIAFFESYYSVYSSFYYSKNNTSYLAYQSISNLPVDTSVLYMPTVPMPPSHKNNSCHVWRDCNSPENLKVKAPDMMYINWNYTYFNKKTYQKFVEDEGYILDETIMPTTEQRMIEDCASTRLTTTINPLSVPERVKQCIELLEDNIDVYSNGLFVGSPIHIYRKN